MRSGLADGGKSRMKSVSQDLLESSELFCLTSVDTGSGCESTFWFHTPYRNTEFRALEVGYSHCSKAFGFGSVKVTAVFHTAHANGRQRLSAAIH